MRSSWLVLGLMMPGLTQGSLQAPRTAHGVSRRTLLLGAAATPLASVVPAAFARVDEVIERARTDTLTTERVILRALRDELIQPKDIDECDVLLKVQKIDSRAADEIVRTNGEVLKLRTAMQETSLERDYLRSVELTYDLGRLVEQRIRERAEQMNFKYQNECVSDVVFSDIV